MRFAAALLLLVVLASGCTAPAAPTPAPASAQPAAQGIVTSDGVRLAYDYAPVAGTKAVLLLHMLNSQKEAWAPLLAAIEGQATLALDFRGHGQSPGARSGAGYIEDARAALAFLRSQGYTEIEVVGASVGADVAIALAAQEQLRAIAVLSPVQGAAGIDISAAVPAVEEPFLYLVDAQDAPAWETYGALAYENEGIRSVFVTGAGHGTDIFASVRGADFATTVADWLEKPVR